MNKAGYIGAFVAIVGLGLGGCSAIKTNACKNDCFSVPPLSEDLSEKDEIPGCVTSTDQGITVANLMSGAEVCRFQDDLYIAVDGSCSTGLKACEDLCASEGGSHIHSSNVDGRGIKLIYSPQDPDCVLGGLNVVENKLWWQENLGTGKSSCLKYADLDNPSHITKVDLESMKKRPGFVDNLLVTKQCLYYIQHTQSPTSSMASFYKVDLDGKNPQLLYQNKNLQKVAICNQSMYCILTDTQEGQRLKVQSGVYKLQEDGCLYRVLDLDSSELYSLIPYKDELYLNYALYEEGGVNEAKGCIGKCGLDGSDFVNLAETKGSFYSFTITGDKLWATCDEGLMVVSTDGGNLRLIHDESLPEAFQDLTAVSLYSFGDICVLKSMGGEVFSFDMNSIDKLVS